MITEIIEPDEMDRNLKLKITKQVMDMKKDINNQSEEDLPNPVRNLFTKLFTIFNSVSKDYDKHNMLFFYVYYVIYALYMGPDCLSQSIFALQECIVGSSMVHEENDGLNIFDENGNRLTLEQLENN